MSTTTDSSILQKIDERFDEFATMVAKGFEQVATKDELIATKDELKDEIKKEVGGLRSEMNVRFAQVDVRFAQVDARFDTLERKVDSLDFHLDKTRDLVADLEEGPITDLQRRVQTVERALKVAIK